MGNQPGYSLSCSRGHRAQTGSQSSLERNRAVYEAQAQPTRMVRMFTVLGNRMPLQSTSQKAPSIHGGDEWLFLVWGLGWGAYVGSSQAR